jgi:hypothetical protein
MAWHELGPSGNYFVCLRIGNKRFRRSLKTDCKDQADADLVRIDENLRLVERGWLAIPQDADALSFLLSNGRVAAPLKIEQVTLKELFSKYFNSLPEGSLEESTLYTMNVHRRKLEKHFRSRIVGSIDIPALQQYINRRQKQKGRRGLLSPTTIHKEINTLRTIWNWGKHFHTLGILFRSWALFIRRHFAHQIRVVGHVDRYGSAPDFSDGPQGVA